MKKLRLLDLFCGAGGCSVGYNRAGFEVVGVDAAEMPRYPFEFHQDDALDYLGSHWQEFDAIHASPPCQAYSSMRHMPNVKEHAELVEPTRELLLATGKPYVIENVPGAPLIKPTMLCGTMFGLGTGDADLRRHRLFETNWPLLLYFGMFCRHGRRAAGKPDRSCIELSKRQSSARTIPVIGQRGIAESTGDRKAARKTISVTGSHGDAGISHTRAVKKRLREEYDRPATIGLWGNAGGASNRDGLLYFSTAERNEAMGIDWMKGGEISQAIPPDYTNFIGLQLADYLTSRVRI